MQKRGNVSLGEVVSVLALFLCGFIGGLQLIYPGVYRHILYQSRQHQGFMHFSPKTKHQKKKKKGIILYYIIYILHSSPVSLRKVNRALLLYLILSHIPRIFCKISLQLIHFMSQHFLSELYFLHHIISYSICFW